VWQPGQRVLCVADGEGRNSVWLAGQGLVVDAFDVASVGVAKARRLAAEKGVSVNFAVSDCDTYPWPQHRYDGVAAIFVQFADPAMRQRLFASIRRCLKPGGTLVLQGYTPRQLDYKTGGPPQVSHLYTEALLREAFADFELAELHDYEAELTEGNSHHGRSAQMNQRRSMPTSDASRQHPGTPWRDYSPHLFPELNTFASQACWLPGAFTGMMDVTKC
jgi:SAM-dependent methyltransferase